MSHRSLHDGREDGLKPLESLSLADVQTCADLLEGMSRTAFGGRQLGLALDVLESMWRDEDCFVVMTISGAMTVAKQGRIVCDLIDRGVVNAIVATGALMAHGLTESIGLAHYEYDPSHSDEKLFEQGYNRIYDTLEMESNLNDIAQMVAKILRETEPTNGVWSSHEFCTAVGRKLAELNHGPGILKSAFEKDVPVFVPAFTDSELGLDFATWAIAKGMSADANAASMNNGEDVYRDVPAFNPFLDLYAYTRRITSAKRIGIFTIGGGVPRNWAQQVGPFVDITNARVGTSLPVPRFQYGVRLCPEPVHWGGLSGCTYSEGISWGKFVPPQEGGRYAEVPVDATIAMPILIKALFERADTQ
ncbi:deoxyhypusine synthase family protein [Calycomorphotria hydatis]|uniref:Putative deoxyhypusine synthase n=1 Tax=Calycomorphotria hydatis TaxID=2528027 RepID=A0A517TDG0_9PLAN|nr:deoxyhypusine synthase family protein [Calycomorphotria hydatis]QDT66403.1 putative deoxyhypusine synthase [Calycomorphotria hydatis]